MEEFIVAFQITKTAIFEVRYCTLGNNNHADFATSGLLFNRPKNGTKCGGQCQRDILPKDSVDLRFFEKWDNKHLCRLSGEDYAELRHDLEYMMKRYNHILRVLNPAHKPYNPTISFEELRILSRMDFRDSYKTA